MNKRIYKILQVSLTILSLLFFAYAVKRSFAEFEFSRIDFSVYSFLTIILFAVAVVASGMLWGRVLSGLTGKEYAKSEMVRVHIYSWLMKYVPGQIGSYLYKINWGNSKSKSKRLVTLSFVYENLFLMIASTLPMLPLLATNLDDRYRYALAIGLAMAVLLWLLGYSNFFKEITLKLLNRYSDNKLSKKSLLSSKEVVANSVYYIIPRAINGVGFILIAESITNISASSYMYLIATYAVAGIIGILAFFVPSGIGVREAVIVFFMAPLIGVSGAVFLSVVARFYTILADGMLWIVAVYLSGRKKELV